MEDQDDSGRQSRSSGSRRTRSQAAPDWSPVESLTLVNEIAAIEGDCRKTLSSFQKWKIIVENCNALDVNRTLNQCRRKWDSLLTDYKRIKLWDSSSSDSYWFLDRRRRIQNGLPEEFNSEVFKAIDDHLKAEEGSDTDPDIDPDAADGFDVVAESGANSSIFCTTGIIAFKKQRSQVIRQKCSIEERVTPRKRSRDKMIIPEEMYVKEKVKLLKPKKEVKILLRNGNTEERKKMVAGSESLEEREKMAVSKLQENAELIIATLEGKLAENEDCVLADLKNTKISQTDFTRRQGDNLIAFLGNLADALVQLCDLLVQENG